MTAAEFESKVVNRYIYSNGFDGDIHELLDSFVIPALAQIMKNQEEILKKLND